MMKKEITCIGCPMGCRIIAELDGDKIISIEGYTCNIGKKYAQEELTVPTRMVTALIKVEGTHQPLSVKTSRPIEKSKIFDCLKEISQHTVVRPIHIGEVIIKNVCGTSVDIVATKELI
ncbi:MAG: NAD(FAD)-dependent dehydrogenase [Caproiciproducens sp.]|jgi:CxxC motif-containing protein|nr:NAD(FAD)-dependent dehydrogenase [Caproiciproducens sp.]